MRDLFTKKSQLFGAGEARSGIAKKGMTLRIVRGRAWVTTEGVSHDYWLAPGSALQPIPGMLTVVEADAAQGDLEVRIERTASSGAKFATQLLAAAQRIFSRKRARATLQRPSIAK